MPPMDPNVLVKMMDFLSNIGRAANDYTISNMQRVLGFTYDRARDLFLLRMYIRGFMLEGSYSTMKMFLKGSSALVRGTNRVYLNVAN